MQLRHEESHDFVWVLHRITTENLTTATSPVITNTSVPQRNTFGWIKKFSRKLCDLTSSLLLQQIPASSICLQIGEKRFKRCKVYTSICIFNVELKFFKILLDLRALIATMIVYMVSPVLSCSIAASEKLSFSQNVAKYPSLYTQRVAKCTEYFVKNPKYLKIFSY